MAVVLAVLGMLGATFRMWYFDIADGLGRTSGTLSLQINLVEVTVVFAIVGAFLAAFGYRLRKQQIARNA